MLALNYYQPRCEKLYGLSTVVARRICNKGVRCRCRRLGGKTLCPKIGNPPAQRNSGLLFVPWIGFCWTIPDFKPQRTGCHFDKMLPLSVHLVTLSKHPLGSHQRTLQRGIYYTLRRFISRRGKPAKIFCNNGRNFVAAA